MSFIKINDLPKIKFAHIFSAEKYQNLIKAEKNRVEISYVSSGNFFAQINDKQFKQELFTVGINLGLKDVLIDANDFHEHHTVCFETSFTLPLDDENSAAIPYVLYFNKKNEIHKKIDEIIRLHTLYPQKELALCGLFLQLLEELSVAINSTSRIKNEIISPYVIKAKDYVYKHLNEQIQEQQIASHLSITPEYLCSVFKKYTGDTLMKFINTAKLNKIRELILHKNFKLSRAATLYGYTDPNYVSKLYKKYFGHNITDFSSQKNYRWRITIKLKTSERLLLSVTTYSF